MSCIKISIQQVSIILRYVPINEYLCSSLKEADFLLPPWKPQIRKNGKKWPWTRSDVSVDEGRSGREGMDVT